MKISSLLITMHSPVTRGVFGQSDGIAKARHRLGLALAACRPPSRSFSGKLGSSQPSPKPIPAILTSAHPVSVSRQPQLLSREPRLSRLALVI